MLGAIVGDVVGSTREFYSIKYKDFPFFEEASRPTDDSILTIAVAHAILDKIPLNRALKDYTRRYPGAGYGQQFFIWAKGGDDRPYGSWGNGASMRVSACAWLARDYAHAIELARWSASATHDHPEGIRGAEATTAAIYLARCALPMTDIAAIVTHTWGYDLTPSVDLIRETSHFELKSEVSVPQALCCALQAETFEDAVRNAVSLGADADTQAAIAGAVAEGAWGVPLHMAERALRDMPRELMEIVNRTVAGALPAVRPTDAELAAIPRWDGSLNADFDKAKEERNLKSMDAWIDAEKAFKAAPSGSASSFLSSMRRMLRIGKAA